MATPRDIVVVERLIDAPAPVLFDVLADPRRHQDIDGSGSVRQPVLDAPARLFQGATFTMRMKRVVPYRMTNTVTEFEEGRRIAWSPKPANGFGARFFGRIWRYEFEAIGGRTRVRETWDLTDETFRFMIRLTSSRRFTRDMEVSLDRLQRIATNAT